MRPTFEVSGNDNCIGENLRSLNGFLGSHGQVEWSDFGNTRCANMQDRDLRREASRYLCNAFLPYCVAGNVLTLFG